MESERKNCGRILGVHQTNLTVFGFTNALYIHTYIYIHIHIYIYIYIYIIIYTYIYTHHVIVSIYVSLLSQLAAVRSSQLSVSSRLSKRAARPSASSFFTFEATTKN